MIIFSEEWRSFIEECGLAGCLRSPEDPRSDSRLRRRAAGPRPGLRAHRRRPQPAASRAARRATRGGRVATGNAGKPLLNQTGSWAAVVPPPLYSGAWRSSARSCSQGATRQHKFEAARKRAERIQNDLVPCWGQKRCNAWCWLTLHAHSLQSWSVRTIEGHPRPHNASWSTDSVNQAPM
jgi:hypothetical protein